MQSIIDFKLVFERLNEELKLINQSLELVCAGGYVLQLHGFRGTADVDAFFETNAAIESAIQNVGDEFGINTPDEVWLNNSIMKMNPPPPPEHRTLVHSFSNLKVEAVDLIYLIGMKLISGRGQDLKDVADILKHNNDEHPLELLDKLNGMEFAVDISGLLDIYEKAHGMEWLTKFYEDNVEELRKHF